MTTELILSFPNCEFDTIKMYVDIEEGEKTLALYLKDTTRDSKEGFITAFTIDEVEELILALKFMKSKIEYS